MGLTGLDFIVIGLYLLLAVGIGLKSSGKQQSAGDYFLGGKSIPWWAVLFSVVATETSTLTFISIPAVAYTGNLTFLQLTFGYLLGRILVSAYFLPGYFKGDLQTAYTFLEHRFGSGMRNAASITFMVTRLLADGVRLFATAIPLAIILRMGGAFEAWSDMEVYAAAILLIAVITLMYTWFGGIRAVIWMDVMQMAIYIGGALLAAWILWRGLPADPVSIQSKLTLIDTGSGLGWKEFIASPYTLLTAVAGGAVFSLASHGTDQLLVQRILTTGNLKDAQKAMTGSGIAVIFQFGLFLGIGLLLYMFYGGAGLEELGLATADEIFSMFIVNELPAGVSGLIIAALFAAAMSSLSSSLNSLASSALFDIYKPYFGKGSDEAGDLKMSRIFTAVWGVILTGSAFLFAWLQLSEGDRPQVVELGLGIASYTYGGLLGAFLLGLFFKKPDNRDALTGFFTGLLVLLFMVDGPVQNILPGEAVVIAWPLYTMVGAAVVTITGYISSRIKTG